MSIDVKEILSRIPQDKLSEIVNAIADITPEQLVEMLGAEGISVSAEEAPALLELLASAVERRDVSEEDLEGISCGAIWPGDACSICVG